MRRAITLLESMFIANASVDTVEDFKCNNVLSVLTDTKAIVKTTNNAFDANLRASIIGKNCNCLQQHNDFRNSDSNRKIRRVLRSCQSLVTHLVNRNADGHEYLVVISIKPIFDSSGKLSGFYSLQLPLLHVTPTKQTLPILIPKIEHNDTDEQFVSDQIDQLFPDIIGAKRTVNVNTKEQSYLMKRLMADEKAKSRTQMTMQIFEGYQQYVEDGISESDSDKEDAAVSLPVIVRHPVLLRYKMLSDHEREIQVDDMSQIVQNEFMEYVKNSNYKRVRLILKQMPHALLDINYINERECTACHIAAHKGDLEMLKILVSEFKADLLTHRWNYTVWAHALNSISKGLGCTQQILDWLQINGAENLAICGDQSVVRRYTEEYRLQFGNWLIKGKKGKKGKREKREKGKKGKREKRKNQREKKINSISTIPT